MSSPVRPVEAVPPRASRGTVVLGFVLSSIFTLLLGAAASTYGPRLWTRVTHGLGGSQLVIADSAWPNFKCSPADLAFRAGDRAPESFGTWDAAGSDPVATAGAALVKGELSLRLTTKGDEPVFIYGLSLVPFHTEPDAEPAWVARLQAGGCGDAKQRLFEAHADQGTSVVDRGVVGGGASDGASDGAPDKDTPTAGLGADFTVSTSDPSHIYVDVSACRGYYEFGLKITYRYRGDEYSDVVGSASKPFRVLGMSQEAPLYAYDPGGPLRSDGTLPPVACPVPSTDAPGGDTTGGSDSSGGGSGSVTFGSDAAGIWSGQLLESNGKKWAMQLQVTAGSAIAQVTYPQLGCTGTVTLQGRSGDVWVAREHIDSGKCTPTGTMHLWYTTQGRLLLDYTPDGSGYSGQATLTRT